MATNENTLCRSPRTMLLRHGMPILTSPRLDPMHSRTLFLIADEEAVLPNPPENGWYLALVSEHICYVPEWNLKPLEDTAPKLDDKTRAKANCLIASLRVCAVDCARGTLTCEDCLYNKEPHCSSLLETNAANCIDELLNFIDNNEGGQIHA